MPGISSSSHRLAPFTFSSRRSPVYAEQGMVAASQPAAVEAGLHMLRQGGSAADAAVAAATVLAVTEPCSTGPGGDAFILYHHAATKTVHALNGSGRSPARLGLDALLAQGWEIIPEHHGMAVTVPGAVAAWCALHERFGKLERTAVFRPAIRLAEQGFSIGPVTSELWSHADALRAHASGDSATAPHAALLPGGRAPLPGERVHNPHLAAVLSAIAEKGPQAFYEGETARRMVLAVQAAGGVLDEEDLAACTAEWVSPLSLAYGGVTVHECPPNGQGIVALSALGILGHTDHLAHPPLSPERLHRQIEALRLAFADARRHVCDPAHADASLWPALIAQEYTAQRAQRILPDRRNPALMHGTPETGSDTVLFCAADRDGNAVSMVNSVYGNFGSGIVPQGLGFALQNRGCNFSLVPDHPNCAAPSKRPYHTIIPCLTTLPDGSLHAALGVMGGFMQPQGHVQVLSALLDDGCDTQTALDRPRFCIQPDGSVALEEGLPEHAAEALGAMRHPVRVVSGFDRKLFGRGQIILRGGQGFYEGGSDPRADGCAFGI